MAAWEKHQTHSLRYQPPSFSSSLLDAIYRSIDETRVVENPRRNTAEDDAESLRRAIMIEKWMESYTSTPRHLPSHSTSSTDSSIFSSSETESSRTSPRSFSLHNPNKITNTPLKRNGRNLMRMTKSKTYTGDDHQLENKVREPISPGGKIANFFNSIFSSRSDSLRKSRSMKVDSATSARSCLSKNASTSKSKRSVRFCPAAVALDDHQDRVGSHFIKKNMDSLRGYEGIRKHDSCPNREMEDMISCGSSDLFELESIGRVGINGGYEEELPVYGTTRIEINHHHVLNCKSYV